jgi:hypothetical protein
MQKRGRGVFVDVFFSRKGSEKSIGGRGSGKVAYPSFTPLRGNTVVAMLKSIYEGNTYKVLQRETECPNLCEPS